MKAPLALLFFAILVSKTAQAQPRFRWAKVIESYGTQVIGTRVLADKASNVYFCGSGLGRVDFDPGPGIDTQYCTTSSISKYDSAGTYLWTKVAPGTAAYALDASGNIYAAGAFSGTQDFDPGPGTLALSAAVHGLFLMKLDKDYNLLWAKKMGTCDDKTLQVQDLKISPAGDIYIGGNFKGKAGFKPGGGTYNVDSFASGVKDGFLLKCTAAGAFAWVSHVYGPNGDDVVCIALDTAMNPVICGLTRGFYNAKWLQFRGSAPTRHLITTDNQYIGYLAKLHRSTGAVQWAQAFNGTVSSANGVAVDATDNVYVVGSAGGTVRLDSADAASELVLSSSGYYGYLAKFSPAGTYRWSRVFSGTSYTTPTAVCTDADGDVFLSGIHAAGLDLDSGKPAGMHTTNGLTDIYVARFSGMGDYKWSDAIGSAKHDESRAILVTPLGFLYHAGYISGHTIFNPKGGEGSNGAVFLARPGASDYAPAAYLMRYDLRSSTNGMEAPFPGRVSGFSVHPNPAANSFTVTANLPGVGKAPARVVLTNVLGQIVGQYDAMPTPGAVFEQEFAVPPALPGGLYHLTLLLADGSRLTQPLHVLR